MTEQAVCPETVTVRVAWFDPDVQPIFTVTFNVRDTPVPVAVERALKTCADSLFKPYMVSVEVR